MFGIYEREKKRKTIYNEHSMQILIVKFQMVGVSKIQSASKHLKSNEKLISCHAFNLSNVKGLCDTCRYTLYINP